MSGMEVMFSLGIRHSISLKFTTLRLDGTWTVPQQVKLENNSPFSNGPNIVIDPHEFNVRTIEEHLNNLSSELEVRNFFNLAIPFIRENSAFSNLNSMANGIAFATDGTKLELFSEAGIRRILDKYPVLAQERISIPSIRHDSENRQPHSIPIDGYTLAGYKWDRIYPSIDKSNNAYFKYGRFVVLLNGFIGLGLESQLSTAFGFKSTQHQIQHQTFLC